MSAHLVGFCWPFALSTRATHLLDSPADGPAGHEWARVHSFTPPALAKELRLSFVAIEPCTGSAAQSGW